MKLSIYQAVVFLCLCCFSCQPGEITRQFLFLGHPYDWHHPYKVDPRLEKKSYDKYDEIWLGGDVCSRTAERPENMVYLDSIFDFKKVRWALGNHDVDYGDPENVLSQLPHSPFFTEWKNGFCLTVLNTNFFWPYPSNPPQKNCEEKHAQWEMMKSVTDTIDRATHWIILHHHALFSDLKADEQGEIMQAFNVNAMMLTATCDSTTSITPEWYPSLVEVQKRGIQVVLIGGDVGMQSKQSEYRTEEGIWLLGSGINNSVPKEHAPEYVTDFGPDKVLELTYTEGGFSWEFVELEAIK